MRINSFIAMTHGFFCMFFTLPALLTLTWGGSVNRVGDVEENKEIRTLRREKRGWVWNQFFVLEEYSEEKPVYIGKLHSDLDNGDGFVKYILSGEGAGTMFTLDDNTGDIYAVQRLDREEKAQYVLHAQATHRLTGRALEPKSKFIVKIQDINDNEPRFLDGPYNATIPEMSPVGTPVIHVTAVDADDPSYGNSARIVYSMVQGQPYFSIHPKTGEVRVSLAELDREVRAEYLVMVQAKDMNGQLGGLIGTTTINVTLSDVNDNPPVFTQKVYQLNVAESGLPGSVVGRIEVKDLDLEENAEMLYRIIQGDEEKKFHIRADSTDTSGIITINQNLDFETTNSYTLKIEGVNTNIDTRWSANGAFSDVTMVHVSVEDVDEPPLFDSTVYYAEVPESAEIGTVITVVSARDPDAANNSIRYLIDQTSDSDQYFYVDMISGSLVNILPLDRETQTWYNLTVVAMETDNPLQVASVSVTVKVLDVNDNPPSLLYNHEAVLCNNAEAGQLVQSVRATDPDEPIGGQRFSYSLAPESQNNPNFTLRDNHDNSAWILTRHSGWDSSAQTVYHLPIHVSDGDEPVQSCSYTLTIRVCACAADGTVLSCELAEPYSLSPNISKTALIFILTCTFTLIVLLMLMLLLFKNSKKSFLSDEEENVCENIVRYDDEGGGEEDTEAFDITAMWRPHTKIPKYTEVSPQNTQQDAKPQHFYKVSERENLNCADTNGGNTYSSTWFNLDSDPNLPPYDSLHTFSYEGDGSVAESLSSLQSSDDDANSYDYLDEWGPRFNKLATLYGASQQDSWHFSNEE